MICDYVNVIMLIYRVLVYFENFVLCDLLLNVIWDLLFYCLSFMFIRNSFVV